ncbi:MAG: hypothetical protein RMJ36_02395 [Candidatus Calescibacterium sp.]|nr:hypothetical protein [Candidatus Calescibacterium sp.]MDW8132488.1 hypothetical protein [Candidatus Calescibacterium sp.]
MENIEKIINKIGDVIKKQKKLPFLKEAYGIFAYKSSSGYKFVNYVTATALLIVVLILGFVIFAFFNCFGAVSSLNKINFITILFFLLSISFGSFFISPFLHGYFLMVYKDIYQNLKSDLSDFFFFIHTFDKNKINYIIEGYIASFIAVFIFAISFLMAIGIGSLLVKFIPSLPVIGFLMGIFLKLIVYIIMFSFSLTLVIVFIVHFILENQVYFNTNVKEFDLGVFFVKISTVLKKAVVSYLTNFVSFLFIGLFMSVGFVTIIGNIITFPLGSMMIGIVLRKRV